jgi:hypothetical protein
LAKLCTGADPDGLAGPQGAAAAADPEPQQPVHDGEQLFLLRVGVTARHPATGRQEQLPGQQVAAGLCGGGPDHDPLPADRVLYHPPAEQGGTLLAGQTPHGTRLAGQTPYGCVVWHAAIVLALPRSARPPGGPSPHRRTV